VGTEGFLTSGKVVGHEADHSLPSAAKVKNCGAIPPFIRTFSWLDAQLIKPGDNFTFTFMPSLVEIVPVV
jgi:hypothetical protein